VNSVGTPGARKARISLSAVIVSIGGSFAGSNAASGDWGAPPLAGRASRSWRGSSLGGALSATASGAIEDFVTSAPSDASRLRRDQRVMKFSGSLIRVLSALVRAAPALLDRRGCARAYGTGARHDARRRRHRSPRAPPPASAPRRRDRCPLRSRLRP